MAFQLSLRHQTLTKLRRIRPLSSSTHPDSSADTSSAAIPDPSSAAAAAAPPPPPPPPPSFASPFRDIKARLRSPPPRRIPDLPLPPPRPTGAPAPASSITDIRKRLAEFRNSSPSPSSSPPILSFENLFEKNHLGKPSAAAAADPKRTAQSFDSIRESLRKFRSVQPSKPSFRSRDNLASSFTPPIKPDQRPSSVFGKEKPTDGAEPKAPKTEFLRNYDYKELGEKLRRLRPEVGDNRFSIAELNDRLVKLRELEEKEADSMMGGAVTFRDLRESLYRVKEANVNKKAASMDRMSILTNITGLSTPAFMLGPPQEELLEKFNHPDHMSAAEKMKLELQKVRDEFKMSESDCGSTRVQVALLTTKIKHLSSVLHKKDKHSRKGLNEMVQKRKKLLKYLRRTDWDSYCFTLSKLGLRDSLQYKASNYKIKA